MPCSPTVAAAYADEYSVAELHEIRTSALEVYTNSATTSRSFAGSSLTIDKRNAEEVLETVQRALRIKEAKAKGLDPDLDEPSHSVSIDRRNHRIT